MTAVERVASRDLNTLADEIRREIAQAETEYQSAVVHAIHAGELLIEAKGQISHGAWLPWLRANFPASVDTAGNYMRLARHSERVRNSLSIRAALKQLAPPEREAEQPDRCPRCELIVQSTRPHKCMQTSRQLGDAHVALRRALTDLRRYPPSTLPRSTSDDEMAATVLHLAAQVQRILSGEPELEEATERQRKSEGVQRTIEGVGIAPCEDCGTRPVEYQGRPYCYSCESYKDGRR